MIIHNLNPVALNLGIVQIYWYGIVYVLGFLLTFYTLLYFKDRLRLTKNQIDDIILGSVIGMLIGARLFHFLFNDPSIFLRDPLELLRVWNGGMSFFGSFIGITTAIYLLMRKWKAPFWKLADLIVLPITLTLVFGRLANFVNAELWGRVTDVAWCVVFPTVEGCRHPYQIYASISHLLLFGALVWFYRQKHKDGQVFFLFAIGYSLFRFLTDFFRVDPMWFGLTNWQWMSLMIFILATGYYYKKYHYIE